MPKERVLSLVDKSIPKECPGDIFCHPDNVGGISYGIYQFASNVGVPQSFVGWLNKKGHPYGRMLAKFAAGTREFSCCWKYIGEHDPEEFELLQDDFVRYNYFVPALERLNAEFGLDIINNASDELKDIIWMMSIEFGPVKTIELMRKLQTSDSLTSSAVSQIDENTLIALIKQTLATAEWLEERKHLSSGLCLPSRTGYLQKKKNKKATA